MKTETSDLQVLFSWYSEMVFTLYAHTIVLHFIRTENEPSICNLNNRIPWVLVIIHLVLVSNIICMGGHHLRNRK